MFRAVGFDELAGANFGCESSREGAIFLPQGLGLCAVIAPPAGDIFASNCFLNVFRR
jgi:3-isopropylmalate/(R)-2-methylmalate dehydratase small subunit